MGKERGRGVFEGAKSIFFSWFAPKLRLGGCSGNCALTRGSAPRPRTLHPIEAGQLVTPKQFDQKQVLLKSTGWGITKMYVIHALCHRPAKSQCSTMSSSWTILLYGSMGTCPNWRRSPASALCLPISSCVGFHLELPWETLRDMCPPSVLDYPPQKKGHIV